MLTSPTLQFPPGPPSGFTPTGLAGFSDLRPAVVVRELLQNSLDAAAEAGEPTASVQFRLYRTEVENVPGYTQYSTAFENAVESQRRSGIEGALPDHAQEVVDTIEERLTDQVCDVLAVTDNGVGLDQRSMTALLSDGTSAKRPDASGSYGNGHMVTVPASDLRYVLYGGVRSDGERVGAGHAILASHAGTGNYPSGADGFLVCRLGGGGSDQRFDFARDNAIPKLIADQVDEIRDRWEHGAAVIIPWFNRFREDRRTLHEIVFKDAACNFFAAIEERRLEVTVEDRTDSAGAARAHKLNRESLSNVLRHHQSERRSAFLSGKMARAAWEAMHAGEKHTVQTGIGAVTIFLRYPAPQGSSRIDLCRNGMWIVDDKRIPGFAYKFGDRQPFHAVMLIDSHTGGELHRLIRKAEAPLHDRVSTKLLRQPSDKKKLRDALGSVRQWLLDRVPGTDAEEYRPDDVLTIESRGSDGPGPGKREMSFWGAPVEVGRRTAQRTLPGPGTASKVNSPSPMPRRNPMPNPAPPPAPVETSLTAIRFAALLVPSGQHSCSIRLHMQQDIDDARLSLCVDENTDVTCDRLWQDDPITITAVRVIGGPVLWEGEATSAALGNLEGGIDHDLDVTFDAPHGTAAGVDNPVLRVEVVSPKAARSGAPAR